MKEVEINTYRSILTWVVCVLVMVIQTGCTTRPTVKVTLKQRNAVSRDLDIVENNRIELGRRDTLYIAYPAGKAEMPQSNSNAIAVGQVSGSTFWVALTANAIAGESYQIQLPTGPVVIALGPTMVWPGDTDDNGVRNLDDLMPIAYWIRRQLGFHGAGFTPTYPPDPTQMDMFSVNDWVDTSGTPLEMMIGNLPVNAKHADCNGDGYINEADADYLMAVLQPRTPSNFLLDQVHQLDLKAEANVSGISSCILSTFEFGLVIPFEISFSNLDPIGVDSIFGVLFTRPVIEDTAYPVNETRFDFSGSQVFNNEIERILWRQKFWHGVNFTSNNDCTTEFDKPLDVGIFRVNGLGTADPSHNKVGNCMVTLEQVLRSNTSAIQQFVLYQHLLDGIGYFINDEGEVTVQALNCELDSAVVPLQNLCVKQSIPRLRDGLGDQATTDTVLNRLAFASPDIWVRKNDDHLPEQQNPVPEDINFVNVRVFNEGCDDLANVDVDVYWALANTNEVWPGDFGGSSQGGYVGMISFPNISTWGYEEASIPWTVPSFPSNGMSGKPVFTLLAKIKYGIAPPLLPGQVCNPVRNHPSVASQSSFILMQDRIATPAWLNWKLPTNATDVCDLVLEQIEGPQYVPLTNYGDLKITDFFPASYQDYQMVQGPLGTFQLQQGKTNGSLSHVVMPSNTPLTPFGIRFTRNLVSLSAPITYSYLLTMKINGQPSNSSVFRITIGD